MTDTFKPLRGEYECFTASPLDAMAVSANPLQAAHDAMVRELARMVVPRIPMQAEPEDFEVTSDYLLRLATLWDLMIQAIGTEVRSNALCNIKPDFFKMVTLSAVHDGPCDACGMAAEAAREGQEEYLGQSRSRGVGAHQ